MIGIKYVAPVWDNSGYAKACRSYITALHKKGIPLCVEAHCFENLQAPVGTAEQRDLLSTLQAATPEYDVVISQLTPDMAKQHIHPGKYNIFYFAWESSVIHPKWIECLKESDEIWVPCKWNAETIRNSGIDKPVRVIPHGIDIHLFDSIDTSSFDIGISDPNTFSFYNIFQWQPRKNPDSLLRSYFNAFTPSDNVVLILKTYIAGGNPNEALFIQDQIVKVKKDMGFSSYPRVLLITSKLSDEQVCAMHMRLDCLVSLHCSEGWGLVPFEAGLAGKPVIATGATGNMEFMNTENSYPVDFQWSYIKDMSSFNGWYLGSGKWAQPNEPHATELMRYVFNNRKEALAKGQILKKHIADSFSWDVVADIMINRLSEL